MDEGGRETLHGSGFDQGYLREGGLDTEVEAAFLMSPTQRMKGYSSSARRADGIGVEVCHPYVVEARRGMLFEQTDEMPLRGMGNLDRGVPTFG